MHTKVQSSSVNDTNKVQTSVNGFPEFLSEIRFKVHPFESRNSPFFDSCVPTS